MAKYVMLFKYIPLAINIMAASPAYADVAAAVALASDGDVVGIPSGTAAWANSLSTNKSITLYGAGIDSTVITPETGYDDYLIKFTEADNIRITGLTLDGGYQATSLGIYLNGAHHDFRIDNCKMTRFGSRVINLDGFCDGVIHNCNFLNNRYSIITYYGDGAAGWLRPVYLGMDIALNNRVGVVFVEDNNFTFEQAFVDLYFPADHLMGANYGGRYVFRYNTMNAAYSDARYVADPIDCHGAYELARGTVSVEIYENIFNSDRTYRMCNIRGGTGVIFNNQAVGTFFGNLVNLTEYKCFSVPKAEFGGACPHDYNFIACPDTGTHPTLDQVNDLYIWNNTKNGVVNGGIVPDSGHNLFFLQENRDFFNIEKSGYIPYTYPHPLRG